MAESNMLAYVMMRLWYSNPLFSYTDNLNFECCYRTCWHIQKKKFDEKNINCVFFKKFQSEYVNANNQGDWAMCMLSIILI